MRGRVCLCDLSFQTVEEVRAFLRLVHVVDVVCKSVTVGCENLESDTSEWNTFMEIVIL